MNKLPTLRYKLFTRPSVNFLFNPIAVFVFAENFAEVIPMTIFEEVPSGGPSLIGTTQEAKSINYWAAT